MPTVKQYKDALRKHNAKHCVKLTGTKTQLAQRARDKHILVRLKKHKSSKKNKKQSTPAKTKAEELARAKQGFYNRVFGDM